MKNRKLSRWAAAVTLLILLSGMNLTAFALGTAVPEFSGTAAAAEEGNPVTEERAVAAFQSALAKAQREGRDRVTLRFKNYSSISFSVMRTVKNRAKQAGVSITIQMDTVVDSETISRISIDPFKASKAIHVSSVYDPAALRSRKEQLEKKNGCGVEVFHLAQPDHFGMEVELALKLDTAKLDTEQLRFYSYNRKTEAYQEIDVSGYTVTDNGYVRFPSRPAGVLFISDGPLKF